LRGREKGRKGGWAIAKTLLNNPEPKERKKNARKKKLGQKMKSINIKREIERERDDDDDQFKRGGRGFCKTEAQFLQSNLLAEGGTSLILLLLVLQAPSEQDLQNRKIIHVHCKTQSSS
jgi:hypothetical protein